MNYVHIAYLIIAYELRSYCYEGNHLPGNAVAPLDLGGEAQNVNIASSIAVSGYENNLCGTGLCIAAAVIIAASLKASDAILTAKDAYELTQLGLACEAGDVAACDQAKEMAIEAGATSIAAIFIPGAKIGGKLLKKLEESGVADDALDAARKAVDDVPQITKNRLHHEEKVGEVRADLEAEGLDVTTEVSFRSCSTSNRCRADVVARDENGKIVKIVEVKTGNANLSSNQSEIYPQVSSGDAIPTGKVAQDFGLTPGVPLRDQGYPNGILVEIKTFEGVNQ